jgi:hypothetical protein
MLSTGKFAVLDSSFYPPEGGLVGAFCVEQKAGEAGGGSQRCQITSVV